MNPIYESPLNRGVPPARPAEFAPVAIGPLRGAWMGILTIGAAAWVRSTLISARSEIRSPCGKPSKTPVLW